LSLVAGFEAEALGRKWKKSFQYDAIRVAISFDEEKDEASGPATQGIARATNGAQPSFELAPLNVTLIEINASTAPPPRFVGGGDTLIEDFFEVGDYAMSSAGDMIAYTGTDPATGEVTIMTSRHDGGMWTTPVELARSGGVGAMVTTLLGDGRSLIAWSEVTLANAANPFPPTVVKYVISNGDGSVWSPAQEVAMLDEVAFDLRLVALGSQALLTFRCTAEGPFGEACSLHATQWNGTVWSALSELLPDQLLLGHELESDGLDKALAVAVTKDNRFLSLAYKDGAWEAAQEVESGVNPPVSLSHDGSGRIAAIWQNAVGDLELSHYDCDLESWTQQGAIVTNALTSDAAILALESDSAPVYLVTWLEGSDTTRICSSFVAPDGSELMARREFGITDTGVHERLSLTRESGARATIHTHFMAASSSLRRYPVGLPQEGDCDGNGIQDSLEIVAGDAADFNGNGVPDHCEIADGTLIDRDRNGIPDEAEEAPEGDLNRNGFADTNEILLGLLSDGNANMLPDEFELFRRTLPLDRGKASQFYRAPRIILREIRLNDFDLDVQGTLLEKADNVTGPWTIVE